MIALQILMSIQLFCTPAQLSSVPVGPYCGLYCVYSAARIQGSTVTFSAILDKRYLSTRFGSTLDDLCNAVRDQGLECVPLQGLGDFSLKASNDPIILHVRRPGFSSQFSHWVLYLGTDNDMARILDPPGDVQYVSFAELLATWDGIGILVGRNWADAVTVRAAGWFQYGTILAMTLVLLGTARLATSRLRNRRWVGPCILLTVVAVSTVVFHLIQDRASASNSPRIIESAVDRDN